MQNSLHPFIREDGFKHSRRFIWKGPEGAGAEAGAAEGAKTELAVKHEENLKALAEAGNDPDKLAAALDNALATTDAMVREKGDTAILSAAQQLDGMLKALGVPKKEAAAIQEEFDSEFKSYWKGEDLKKAELKDANEVQQKTLTEAYKQEASTAEKATYDTNLAAIEQSIGEASGAIEAWETTIESRGDSLESAQEATEAAADNVVETAKEYGLEGFTAERIATMPDDQMREKLFAAKMAEDPTFDAYDPEQQKVYMDAYVTKIQQAVVAMREAAAAETAAQQALAEAEGNKEGWEKALATREQGKRELNDNYWKTVMSINNGTYAYSSGETINGVAEQNAAALISPEEKAIIDKYTELAVAKAKELSREVVYKQLEKFKAEAEAAQSRIARNITAREAGLQKKVDVASAELDKVKGILGIDGTSNTIALALNSTEGARRLIIASVKQDYPEGKSRTDLMAAMRAPDEETAITMRAEQLYTRKYLPAYEKAVAATTGQSRDAILLAHKSALQDSEARLARIDAAMARLEA